MHNGISVLSAKISVPQFALDYAHDAVHEELRSADERGSSFRKQLDLQDHRPALQRDAHWLHEWRQDLGEGAGDRLINFGHKGTLEWKRLILSELIEPAAVVSSDVSKKENSVSVG